MSDVGVTPLPATRPEEASSLSLIATLFVAGAVSGLLIAGAFRITKPIIDDNNAAALRRAVYKVVPGSSTMQRLVVRDGKFEVLPETQETAEPVIYAAYDDDGKFVGYAIENRGSGFQDVINLLYGFDPVRRLVTGLEILDSRETPGLGDKIFKDAEFAANFTDLAVDPEIVVVKTGRSAKNEVDAITGATISSKAVVKIVSGGNQQWLSLMPAAGAEPTLQQAEPVGQQAKPAGQQAEPVGQQAKPVGQQAKPVEQDANDPASVSDQARQD